MDLKFNWYNWLGGLVAAFISAAAGAIAVVIVDPMTFNIKAGLVPLLEVIAVFGIIAAANYLKDYPTPRNSNSQAQEDK
jgi:uncharacterized membrane protein